MERRKLGKSGLELPVVTFGAWAIGGLFWGGSDGNDALAAIHAALDQGIDAIDTAPMYGCGQSEILIGKALLGKRNQVKLLTKCGLRWDDTSGEFYFQLDDTPSGVPVTAYKNVRADSIRYECEQSLHRLQTDVIDLYQVHQPSRSAPADETMEALTRLQEQGKIRAFGVSNYSASQMGEALMYGAIVSDQVRYSLLERGIERDALPYCRQRNLGVICYSPMARGLLTGKVGMERTFPASDTRSGHKLYTLEIRRRVLQALESLRPIAEAHQATFGQLAVAWVLAQPGITTALVGARTASQVKENAAAAALKLSPEEVTSISQAFDGIGA